jgi:hypothetical protein
MKLKNIYKKSLAMALIRRGHDLQHTMRNRANEKYQIFVFEQTAQLTKDLLDITGQDRIDRIQARRDRIMQQLNKQLA